MATLTDQLRAWGRDAGFADVGVSRLVLDADAAHLAQWLREDFHGSMAYMARSAAQRASPHRLRPGTITVISARMDCTPAAADARAVLKDRARAYIARYALGRDYHRVLRQRLKQLAERMRRELGPFGYRVLTDSAPVFEKALARNARLGWIGKNTLVMSRSAGSFFLLGEIYCDLPLEPDAAAAPRNHCGSCRACLDACPTGAIVAPYRLDARRCISYLTIENRGAIPLEFRRAIGNRIFGCDDCQLACPWNKYAKLSSEKDFAARHGFDHPKLTELFAWSETEWLAHTEGMALRRATYTGWLRNVAVALGNAPTSPEVLSALRLRAQHPDPLVREHVEWALAQHR
ncbi:MAG: tRNA epoxyqueuosine(34) reductase QueG [Nevskiaceae bacterium]